MSKFFWRFIEGVVFVLVCGALAYASIFISDWIIAYVAAQPAAIQPLLKISVITALIALVVGIINGLKGLR